MDDGGVLGDLISNSAGVSCLGALRDSVGTDGMIVSCMSCMLSSVCDKALLTNAALRNHQERSVHESMNASSEPGCKANGMALAHPIAVCVGKTPTEPSSLHPSQFARRETKVPVAPRLAPLPRGCGIPVVNDAATRAWKRHCAPEGQVARLVESQPGVGTGRAKGGLAPPFLSEVPKVQDKSKGPNGGHQFVVAG